MQFLTIPNLLKEQQQIRNSKAKESGIVTYNLNFDEDFDGLRFLIVIIVSKKGRLRNWYYFLFKLESIAEINH